MRHRATHSWNSLAVAGSLLALALAGCAPSGNEPGDQDFDDQPAEVDGHPQQSSVPPAETSEPTHMPARRAHRAVPAGTPMTFRTDETVSTGSHHEGDTFTARLQDDVVLPDGSVALEAGSQSRWVVTRSDTDAGDQDEALLAFRLESLRIGDEWVPVKGTVTDAQIHSDAGDTKTESAAKVAVGAAAGAIIGQILGRDTRATLEGAGVGAAVGAVVALTTRDGKAELPSGSTIDVRLDEPVSAG